MAKVADIFALLGLKVDKAAFGKGQAQLQAFTTGAKKPIGALGSFIKSTFLPLVGITSLVFGAKDALSWTDAVGRLGITAKGGLGPLDELSGRLLDVSDATGLAKDQVLLGTSKFIELTGNVKVAGEQMELFAKVAQATGAASEDVAGSAAALSEQFKIDPADFEKMFSILIEGGKAGSAEFKDMAGHLAGIGAAAQKFAGGTGVQSAAELSAALQIVSGTTGGNVAEATTQIKAMFTGLGQASKGLKAVGVNVFDARGEYRNLIEIMDDLKAKGLSAKEIEDLFPNVRAQRGVLALLRGDWKGLTDQTLASNATAEDYATIQQNAAIKVSKAWVRFKNDVTRVFAVVVDGMGWLTDHLYLIPVALASVAAAFVILEGAAVGAGMAAARAWIMGMLPLVALAALIAAIILIVQDLWTTLNGGEGMFDGTWLEDIFLDAIAFWDEQLTAFFEWLERRFKWVADKAKDVMTLGGLTDGKLLSGGIDANELPAVARARASGMLPPSVNGRGAVSSSLVVNVEAGANVTQDTIKQIADKTQDSLQRQARQLASEAQ